MFRGIGVAEHLGKCTPALRLPDSARTQPLDEWTNGLDDLSETPVTSLA